MVEKTAAMEITTSENVARTRKSMISYGKWGEGRGQHKVVMHTVTFVKFVMKRWQGRWEKEGITSSQIPNQEGDFRELCQAILS